MKQPVEIILLELIIITFSMFACFNVKAEECGIYTDYDGEFVQFYDYVQLTVSNPTSIPKLHVLFTSNNTFQFQFSHVWAYVYKLRDGVIWPCQISIDNKGFVVRMYKVNKGNWTEPFYESLDLDSHPTKTFWKYRTTVANKTQITHNTYLIKVHYMRPVYNHIAPGRYVGITRRVRGKRRDNHYMHVPLFPMKSRSDPNPAPGEWFSSKATVNFLVKSYGRYGYLSRWLSKTNIGDEVLITIPMGSFSIKFLKNCNTAYLFAAGSGITPMLGLIVWLIQQRREFRIKLYFFNRHEKDMILKDELEETSARFPQFSVEYILSQPLTQAWKGRVGRIGIQMLKEMVEPFQKGKTDRICFLSCGPQYFAESIHYNLSLELGYPNKRIHSFLGFEDRKVYVEMDSSESL